MVERVVFLGSATQVMLRLAPGVPLQALVQNDGDHPELAQGTPVHVHLPSEALRVLAGARGNPGPGGGAAGRQLGSAASVGTLAYACTGDYGPRVGAGFGGR